MTQQLAPRKIYDEPIFMVDVSAGVNLFGFRLGVGTKIIFHENQPQYHSHEHEIDVIVTGEVSAGVASSTIPTHAVNLLRQAFAEFKLAKGTKHAYYVHESGLSWHQTRQHTSEPVHIATASAGMRSFLDDRSQFVVWNPTRNEATVYDGTGGKVSTPPLNLLSPLLRRFGHPAVKAISMIISETAGVAVLSGHQRIYRF